MLFQKMAVVLAVCTMVGCTEPVENKEPVKAQEYISDIGAGISARDDESSRALPGGGAGTLPPGVTLPPDFTLPPGFTPPDGFTPPSGGVPIGNQPPTTTPVTNPVTGPVTSPITSPITSPNPGANPSPVINPNPNPINTNPPIAGSVMISLVELNDLHAHMTSHADYNTAGVLVNRGGLARIATAINSVRSDNPNTIVMNIGDTYHGGVEAFYTEGNAIVDPVNGLGIDVGVPGNWDFAFGPSVTRLRYTNDAVRINPGGQTIKQPNFPNLAANVTNQGIAAPRPGETLLPPTFTKTVAGIRVGFIGITSDMVPKMHPVLAFGMSFLQGQSAYAALIEQHANALRSQGAQVVVVMSELGIQKDLALANGIPSGLIDVFFSAHTHEVVTTAIPTNSGALVVESGNDTYIGRMDITVANGMVTDRQWQLIPVDGRFAENANVKSLVDAERAAFLSPTVNMTPLGGASFTIAQTLTQPIDTVLGQAPTVLDRRSALENALNNVYTEMMQQKTGTQMALILGFRFDTVNPSQGMFFEDNTIATGDVTLEDAYRFFPAPFVIATADITGAQLIKVIEDNLTQVFSSNTFNQWGGWFDGFSGIDIDLNLAGRDGSRVNRISFSGSGIPINAGDVVSVTGCQRPFEQDPTVLCSHAGFSNVAPVINSVTGGSWTSVDLFSDAISNGFSTSSRKNIIDNNMTPLWPDAPYIQPLYGVP